MKGKNLKLEDRVQKLEDEVYKSPRKSHFAKSPNKSNSMKSPKKLNSAGCSLEQNNSYPDTTVSSVEVIINTSDVSDIEEQLGSEVSIITGDQNIFRHLCNETVTKKNLFPTLGWVKEPSNVRTTQSNCLKGKKSAF